MFMADIEAETGGNVEQPWPKPGHAYYALAIIILGTMLNFFDANVFTMMAQRIKIDFALSDEQLGWLIGPANIIFFLFIGIPLARLVDIYPRKYVLAAGISLIGSLTMIGALAQNFTQVFISRMFVGVGGSAHAPGAYSMISDFFPPARVPRAIGFLQIGFIGGTALGMILGGVLISWVSTHPPILWMGLTLRGWQLILMAVGAPGLLVGVLMLLMKEPPRRGITDPGKSLPFKTVLQEIWARRRVYFPMMLGLALANTEAQGLMSWRVPFVIRTYHWNEAKIGLWSGPAFLVASLVGAFFGTIFVEWLAERYRDANVRAVAILVACAAPFSICGPLMPTGELSLLMLSIGGMMGIASAVPQNSAIQRIIPDAMRGQITAIYLFFFIVSSAFGSWMVGAISTRVLRNDANLWMAMFAVVLVLLPLSAVCFTLALKPYRQEIARLDARTPSPTIH
jgi:MFS family permease